jgi:2,3-bisphosphoglycerate-dependent phosphoglycerate mutase
MKTATLALVRHGESEWNALGMWTGHMDVGLSLHGKEQAKHVAALLSSIHFDLAYTSQLKRTQETLEVILTELGETDIPVTRHPALSERNYGIYTGKNKEEIKKDLGDELYLSLRRAWDHPIPEGESLKDVYGRVVPFYTQEILPHLKAGKNVLIVSHGNTIRALAKDLEAISDEDIKHREIETGGVWVYELVDGKATKK